MPVTLAASQRADGRESGLLVTAVADGGPAGTAGVVVGDVVVRFDGAPVTDPDELVAGLRRVGVGTAVTLGLVRGAATLDLAVTVGERQRG
jgi:putative serine protease PepD